jgi:hypothetical protein
MTTATQRRSIVLLAEKSAAGKQAGKPKTNRQNWQLNFKVQRERSKQKKEKLRATGRHCGHVEVPVQFVLSLYLESK